MTPCLKSAGKFIVSPSMDSRFTSGVKISQSPSMKNNQRTLFNTPKEDKNKSKNILESFGKNPKKEEKEEKKNILAQFAKKPIKATSEFLPIVEEKEIHAKKEFDEENTDENVTLKNVPVNRKKLRNDLKKFQNEDLKEDLSKGLQLFTEEENMVQPCIKLKQNILAKKELIKINEEIRKTDEAKRYCSLLKI